MKHMKEVLSVCGGQFTACVDVSACLNQIS